MSKLQRILLIPFDHLNAKRAVLSGANPKTDLVLLIQSERMCSGRDWHPERLFFLISSARHFAAELEQSGFQVRYLKSENTSVGLKKIQKEFPGLPVLAAEPSSFKQFSPVSYTHLTLPTNREV